ncbi:MAG: hypothetical protein AB7P21_24935 [Lautropia sp.]
MSRTRSHPPSRARQRGAVLYLFAIAAAAAMVALALAVVGRLDPARARAVEEARVLDDAKRLLLAHLANPELDPAGAPARRLGEPGITPDLPIAPGAGADATEPSYDGEGETGGCATRTWVPGTALQMPDAAGAGARCFGRFPWRTVGLALPPPDPQDPLGLTPWLVLSPNLLSRVYLRDLTPTTLSQPWGGYGLQNRPPYPWIVVRDARGHLLSDRVAAALILPGPPLAGQTRTATAGPAAWLDRLTVAAGCATPCQPGTYDNAGFAHADGTPTTLIAGPLAGEAADRSGLYAQPLQFNDRLAWITVDELMAAMERRARAALLVSLERYRATRGHYPFAAPLGTTDGSCASGQRFGHPPVAAGTCTDAPSLPAWFTDAGWHRWFVYAASPRCVDGSTACNAPGIVVDLAGGGSIDTANAVVISPGAPIVTAPFAPSRGGAQSRANGLVFSSAANDWLDDAVSAGAAGAHFAQGGSAAAPSNDRLEILR